MKSMHTQEKVTAVKAMFRPEGIEFAREEDWNVLAEHIEMHRYHVNHELSREVSWQDAVFSWYENVFTPLMRVINSWGVRTAFPGKPLGDIYLAVSDHWLYLKEKDPTATADEAAMSFVRHYGQGMARWFSRFLVPASA